MQLKQTPFLHRTLTLKNPNTSEPSIITDSSTPLENPIFWLAEDSRSLSKQLELLQEQTDNSSFCTAARKYLVLIRKISARLISGEESAQRIKRLNKAFHIFEATFEDIIRKSSDESQKLLALETAGLAYCHLSVIAQNTKPRIPSNGRVVGDIVSRHTIPPDVQERSYVQPTVLFRVDKDLARPAGKGPHSFRNSAFFFPVNPCRLHTDDILMPFPEKEEIQYTIENGEIQTASFYSLVCLLTSKQSVKDHKLTDITMRFFKIFASPFTFLAALIKRYNSICPDNITAPQQRVWESNLNLTRIRIFKTMLIWLDQYWQEEDKVVLKDLSRFVRKCMPKNMTCSKLEVKIQIKIKRRDKPLPELPAQAGPREPTITCLSLTPYPQNDSDTLADAFKQFNTPKGREKLARQLTLLFSAKFRQIQHIKVVAIWKMARILPEARHIMRSQGAWSNLDSQHAHLVPTMEVLDDVRNGTLGLSMWVLHTIIIEPVDSQGRADTIGFWIHVAPGCIDYRNYLISRAS